MARHDIKLFRMYDGPIVASWLGYVHLGVTAEEAIQKIADEIAERGNWRITKYRANKLLRWIHTAMPRAIAVFKATEAAKGAG